MEKMESPMGIIFKGMSIGEVTALHEEFTDRIAKFTRGCRVRPEDELGLLVTLQGTFRYGLGANNSSRREVSHGLGKIHFNQAGEFELEYNLDVPVSTLTNYRVRMIASDLEEAKSMSVMAMEIMMAEYMQGFQPSEGEN
jgi:hypothetical protein